MISLLLMGQIGQLFLMILMGYILVKSGLLKSTDSKTISVIVLYLVIPCTIINSFQVDYTVETRNGLILAVIAAIFIHIIFFALTKLLGKIFKFNSIEKASIIYSNAGNLIIPIVAGILGDKWVLYCCGFMSVQLVFLWTHCKMMISEEKGADLRKIIINVNTIAILIGLILFITGIKLPGITKDTVAAVSKLIAPLSMIVAGMLMAGVKLRTIFTTKRIYLVALMRMIIYPAVGQSDYRQPPGPAAEPVHPPAASPLLTKYLPPYYCPILPTHYKQVCRCHEYLPTACSAQQ